MILLCTCNCILRIEVLIVIYLLIWFVWRNQTNSFYESTWYSKGIAASGDWSSCSGMWLQHGSLFCHFECYQIDFWNFPSLTFSNLFNSPQHCRDLVRILKLRNSKISVSSKIGLGFAIVENNFLRLVFSLSSILICQIGFHVHIQAYVYRIWFVLMKTCKIYMIVLWYVLRIFLWIFKIFKETIDLAPWSSKNMHKLCSHLLLGLHYIFRWQLIQGNLSYTVQFLVLYTFSCSQN